MLPWLFPVGVVGAVAAISLSDVFGYLLAVVWGWILFPFGAAYIRSHSRTHGGIDNMNPFIDDDTEYWRTRLL
jgi:hypothetical protein